LVLVVLALAFMISESPLATAIVVSDGALVVLFWIAAVGLGWWVVTLLGLSDSPLRWQIVAAAGLGIGLLALLVLLLGSLGVLQQGVWAVLLGTMILACVVRAGLHAYRQVRTASPQRRPVAWRWEHGLWVTVIPFLVVALLEATIPPGLSWGDEAGGYDVLEYHFGGPKEYWLEGRVVPLPHNIYTYFPANAEMLYLLAFVIKGGPFDGIYLAQLLNASLAIWVVAAAWLAGREFGAFQGIVAGVLAATCPWLTYLSGMAYVENGLLFLGMLTLAVVVRLLVDPASRCARWFLLGGLSAGLACGFKYTAVPMVFVPLGLVALGVGRCGGRFARRIRRPSSVSVDGARPSLVAPVLFVVGAGITFSPWLARNFRIAGNPVFPLAHRTLGYHANLWDETLAERWDRAHGPQPDEAGLAGRLGQTWQRLVAGPNYGPAIFLAALLALPGLAGPQRRVVIACLVVLTVQFACWLTATHLFARFGVPMIGPLVVLGAVGWSCLRDDRANRVHRILLAAIILLGAAVNLVHLGRLYYHHTRDASGERLNWFGAGLALVRAEPLNRFTPERGTTVWMVGEARAFYVARPCFYHVVFSRNPLAEFAASRPTGAQLIRWFRDRGVTHVYIGWSEIARFRRPGNYGWHESLDEDLFASMRTAGALITCAERDARSGRPLYEILEVPAE